jgi:integrase/recombinase XerD
VLPGRGTVLDCSTTTEQFITARTYLKNVTGKTLSWYRDAFRAFQAALDGEEAIKERIVELRQRGVAASSVNSWLRVVNAYLHWQCGADVKCSPACQHIKLGKLKEPQKILATLSGEQIYRLVQFRPQGRNARRVHCAACLILDTGLRISEALGLRRQDVDLENLVLHVLGKGMVERLVPLSLEGRKLLYRYISKQGAASVGTGYVFGTSRGTRVSVRNAERDLKLLFGAAGITGVRCSPHTLRHSFAVQYLRRGGNVEYLRRILGHTSITTTQRYLASLGVEDLGAVHSKLSPLSRS